MLIDMVDEKVRRILLLDPEKFNGRLPYGIRGDKVDDDSYIKMLQEQNAQLLASNKELESEVKRLKHLLDDLRKRVKALEVPKAEPVKEEIKEVPTPTGGRRSIATVETKTVEVEKIVYKESKWNDENVQKAIDEAVDKATRPLLKKIKELEEKNKQLQEE